MYNMSRVTWGFPFLEILTLLMFVFMASSIFVIVPMT